MQLVKNNFDVNFREPLSENCIEKDNQEMFPFLPVKKISKAKRRRYRSTKRELLNDTSIENQLKSFNNVLGNTGLNPFKISEQCDNSEEPYFS